MLSGFRARARATWRRRRALSNENKGSGQFEKAACTSPVGVILSAAAFQAERRISRLTGPARKPNYTTTEIKNLRKFKTLGNPT
jgi:hypothetical protein